MKNYGLTDEQQVVDIAKRVVSVFGGGFKAVQALVGICCVETDLGSYPDKYPLRHGIGLTQFDKIGFDDVQKRTRKKDKIKLKNEFGYIMEDLKHEDLAYNPELAIIFARLKYKLIPDPIPADIPGQARYWKKFYNSEAGEGTVEDYLSDWEIMAPINVR